MLILEPQGIKYLGKTFEIQKVGLVLPPHTIE